LGLRLAFDSKQKTELVNIGRYSTTHAEYVNDFEVTQMDKMFYAMSTHIGSSNIITNPYD